jgi:hypothetical protein
MSFKKQILSPKKEFNLFDLIFYQTYDNACGFATIIGKTNDSVFNILTVEKCGNYLPLSESEIFEVVTIEKESRE